LKQIRLDRTGRTDPWGQIRLGWIEWTEANLGWVGYRSGRTWAKSKAWLQVGPEVGWFAALGRGAEAVGLDMRTGPVWCGGLLGEDREGTREIERAPEMSADELQQDLEELRRLEGLAKQPRVQSVLANKIHNIDAKLVKATAPVSALGWTARREEARDRTE
jgi:hypothetical protein